jgi:hypothetical protein
LGNWQFPQTQIAKYLKLQKLELNQLKALKHIKELENSTNPISISLQTKQIIIKKKNSKQSKNFLCLPFVGDH